MRAIQTDRAQGLVVGHAAGADEVERPVDLAGDRLVALAGRRGADEILVPVVQAGEVGETAGEVRAQHVHGGGRVRIRPDHALRVGDPGRLLGVQRVDQVAAVGRQAQRIGRRGPRLCILPGDARHLDHRHRGAVGQHDRHLQQRASIGQQVTLRIVGERLGAVTALQQEGSALAHLGELDPQLVDLVGRHDRGHVVEHLADRGDLVHVRPGRHLHPRQGPPAVEAERRVLGGVGGRAGGLQSRVAHPRIAELMPLSAHAESVRKRGTGFAPGAPRSHLRR